jgi:hypothetical protein
MINQRPLCVACATAGAELKPSGTGWKKRCAECQRNFELRNDRERMARRKLRLTGSTLQAAE